MAWPVWPSGLRWPSGHGLLAYWPMARPYRPMACLRPQAQQPQEDQWPVSSGHLQPPTGNQPPDRENFGPVSPCSGRSATKWPEADQIPLLLRGVTPDFGHSVSPHGILLRRMGPGGPPEKPVHRSHLSTAIDGVYGPWAGFPGSRRRPSNRSSLWA